MANKDKRVKFMARIPPELHRWLKVEAAERGVNMNDVLVASLDSARMRLAAGTKARGTTDMDTFMIADAAGPS
jgi:hypothetical protein